MAEIISPCSYPGCPEPAVVMVSVHHVNTATGESVTSPAHSVCSSHFYLLWKMGNDPEFRQRVFKALALAQENAKKGLLTFPFHMDIPYSTEGLAERFE